MTTLNDSERRLYLLWADTGKEATLPYGHFGACYLCKSDRDSARDPYENHRGEMVHPPLWLKGRAPDLCICFRCYLDRGGTAPRAASPVTAGDRESAPRAELDSDVARTIKTLREQGLGYPAIAETLNERGVPTASGGRWHGPTIRNVCIREYGSPQAALAAAKGGGH